MMCCMAGWDANHYNPGVITVYVQIFEACNYRGFHGQLAIRKIFILEILLAKLWLASIREQDTSEEQLRGYV